MKFRYEAKGSDGSKARGEVEAVDVRDAAARIRAEGLVPIDIVPARGAKGATGFSAASLFRRRVKLAEKALFFRELATMTEAGVPVAASLRVLAGQKRSRRFEAVIADIYERVSAGSTLAAAFDEHAECFDAVAAAFVRAGEESGTLDENLAKIASFLEAREELRKKIISSLSYPALVLCVTLCSLCLMTTVVIPQFERAFRGVGVDLPPLTRAVFGFGAWMDAHWRIIAFILAAAVAAAKFALRNIRIRAAADGLLLKIPIFGEMFLKAALARSFSTIGALLRSGLPMLSALRLAASASGNQKIKKALEAARDAAASGRPLSVSLDSEIFPHMIIQMAAVGEETGRTGEMFEKIAAWYESELTEKVKRLSSILEPVMVVIVGVIVGVMAVAIFLPVVSAINAFI